MSVDPIAWLVAQHRRMEQRFHDLLEADVGARATLFPGAADELMSHVLVEEEVFYPAVKSEKTEDILLESLEEHLSLKRVLDDLVGLAPDDPHFEPKLHVLEEQVRHHHEEEEEHLFPKVHRLMSSETLARLGERMAKRREELLAREPRHRVHAQTDAAKAL